METKPKEKEMKNNIKRFFMAVSILLASSQTFASTVYLDADSFATGSGLVTTPLVTSLGTISYIGGELSTFADPDFTAVGASGNNFNIGDNLTAEFTFDFDVQSISFIFGGNGGAFDIFARDIDGNTVDSYSGTTENGAFAGPMTLAGAGIRSLFWSDDPGWNFAALDNVTISAVPVPAAAWLFGSALLGFFGFSRKKANA